MTTITVDQKKEFMKYILNQYSLQRRECVWILNYLMNYDSLIEKIHFVEDALYTPKGLVMATRCSDKVPFRYYKPGVMTTDAEKAFHDIRLNKDEDIYIEFHFKHRDTSVKWHGVLEDNPFIPEDVFKHRHNQDSKIANNLLENVQFHQELSTIDRLIDDALISGDKRTFMILAEQRNELLAKKPPTAYETVKR